MKEEIFNGKEMNMNSTIFKIRNSRKNNGTSIEIVIGVNDKIFINYLMISYEKNKEDFLKMISKHKKFIVESLRSDKNNFYKKSSNIYIKFKKYIRKTF